MDFKAKIGKIIVIYQYITAVIVGFWHDDLEFAIRCLITCVATMTVLESLNYLSHQTHPFRWEMGRPSLGHFFSAIQSFHWKLEVAGGLSCSRSSRVPADFLPHLQRLRSCGLLKMHMFLTFSPSLLSNIIVIK